MLKYLFIVIGQGLCAGGYHVKGFYGYMSEALVYSFEDCRTHKALRVSLPRVWSARRLLGH